MNVVFDTMGRLFELTPIKERLGDAATEACFDAWLAATIVVPSASRSLTALGELRTPESAVSGVLRAVRARCAGGRALRAGAP